MRKTHRPGVVRSRAGISRRTVLVILGCLGLVALLVAPAIQQATAAARRTRCKCYVKQITLALHNNHDVDKSFPPGSTSRASWLAHILPFVDQNAAYVAADPRNGVAPVDSDATVVIFRCPSNLAVTSDRGITTYLASSGRQTPSEPMDEKLRGVFRDEAYDRETGGLKTNVTEPLEASYRGWSSRGSYFNFRDNSDGTSGTIALGETAQGGVRWCPPYDPVANRTFGYVTGTDVGLPLNAIADPGPPVVRALFSSDHPGGAQFGVVDGSAHFLSDKIDPAVFAAFLTIRGGERDDLPQ